jgi:hypothetical protein
MTWITPKTDWYGVTDANGNYTGDRFNADDYNRITNNLQCLYDLAISLYKSFNVYNINSTKTVKDYLYANDINNIEQNFALINGSTLRRPYGNTPTYYANGKTMDYTELNRLESAMLDLYNKMMTEFDGRRTLTWNFGTKGDF